MKRVVSQGYLMLMQKIRELLNSMVKTIYKSSEDMIDWAQSLKATSYLKFHQNNSDC